MGILFSNPTDEDHEASAKGIQTLFSAAASHATTVPCRVAYCAAKLDPRVLSALQEEPFFSAEEADLEALGFDKNVDHPQIPGHRYYEAIVHGLPSATPVRSIHARFGYMYDKQPAPLRLRAFAEAFRRANAAWIACTAKANPIFSDMVARGWAFADCAVQVHAGDEVPASGAAWHRDLPNSCLHLALSIRGRRALHVAAATASNEKPDVLVGWQDAGDAYLSSLAAFRHAVQYSPAPEWADRIIAIQFRFLVTDEDFVRFRSITSKDWPSVYDIITNAIIRHGVVLPSFDDLLQAEQAILATASNETADEVATKTANETANKTATATANETANKTATATVNETETGKRNGQTTK